ncbi:CCA tRNA nucleotidyltransferase [Cyanobium sp. ATX 6A2]|jgi:tRNA nucleotidyltransferase (CCA-adding enzyme)|uniref:CCA tRNA nucleotidyltransferase n=1 Tax=Cyanobium sp. ATX 6A2 TaxID=2823700 RepID=UPI0020CE0523|nr:CCA tRNA nucleotidyltransferase [Cyanobium sp. ATX 6A2]MCP9888987.1 CCA tRNA nucleotidyltransferase [Cyanobium sp. ATX 6A2]
MHIPAGPRLEPIVTLEATGGELERRLWERLAPAHWPIDPHHLPAGTALVGGAVRDALLGQLRERPDLDLVVPAGAIALGQRLARQWGGSCVVLDRRRDIARLVLADWTIDLARQEGTTLSDDLGRRDFSANAIALPLPPGAPLLDPTGGLAALRRGQLVAVAEANLIDDPLRLLRGIRLRWQLQLQLEPTTAGWIAAHAHRLVAVAGERVLSELQQLAVAAHGEQGLAQALELGLLTPWAVDAGAAPRLAVLDAGAPARLGLDAAESAAALPLARLAALLPGQAVRDLRGSRRLQRQCGELRHWWQRLRELGGAAALAALEEGERLRLQGQLETTLPALLLALPAPQARSALARWRDGDDPLFHPRPPLSGDRLGELLAVPPGPELGELLRHLTRERAFGRLPVSGEREALAAARLWLGQRRGYQRRV